MANYMAEVAKMLGVEIGEEFKLKDSSGEIRNTHRFKITINGLCKFIGNTWVCHNWIGDLLIGKYEIVKLPWKPKNEEGYYYPYTYEQEVFYALWVGSTLDYAMYNLGMCYRTKEEAEEHFAEDYKKLTGEELEQ